jgi:hypothetical protein
VRDFEFQHHDGDEDGDDAVAEGFKPVLAHLFPFDVVAPGAVPRQ